MVGIMQMLLSSGGGPKEVTYNITANTTNLNLLSYATSPARPADTRYPGGAPAWDITFQISPGVYVGSTSTTANSIITGSNGPTSWSPDVSLTLVNQGLVLGKGGNGGTGVGIGTPATAGQAGGTAVVAQRAIVIQNAGTVAGGGGGGGAGNVLVTSPGIGQTGGSGGGGGAGQQPGTGGSGGGADIPGTPGQNGTVSAGGAGGTSPTGTAGAAGGGRGQAGSSGAQTTAGGAAGFYAKGASNITWQATGTRQGQVQPST